MANVVLKFNTGSDEQNELKLDDGDIVDLNSLSQSTPDNSGINYGCLANSGSIDIIDYNGKIANMIEAGELPASSVGVDVFFNGNKIQSHITTDSSYNENSKTFSISLSNTIKELSTRTFSGYKYPNKSATLYDLLYSVMNEWFGRTLDEETEFKPMLSSDAFYSGRLSNRVIYEHLESISLKYPVIEPNQTFEAVINQICTVAQLQMFMDNSGMFKFISARPVSNIEKPIHIPLRNISSEIKKDVFIKNKYDGVDIIESFVNVSTDYSRFITKIETGDISEATQNILPDSFSASDLTSGVFDFEKTSTGKDVAYIKAGRGYISGTAYIPKSSNMNLEQVQEVSSSLFSNNDQNSPKYSITYLYESNNCNSTKTSTSSDSFNSALTIGDEIRKSDGVGNYDNNLLYDAIVNFPFDTHLKPSVTLKDDSKLTISEDLENNRYIIDYYILACQYEIKMNTSSNETTSNIPMSGFITTRKAKSIEISLYGNVKKIEFSDTIERHFGVNDANVKVTIPSNKLLQDKTLLGSKKISDVISNNILLDYANGVKTAKLTVVTVDYYDSVGNRVVNGNAGELIQIGDIVEVEGQKNKSGELIKWRVTGSNFRYDGEPLQELELMELSYIIDKRLYYYPTVTNLAYYVTSWNPAISGNLVLGGQYNDGEHGLMDVVAIPENGFSSCKNIREVVINAPIKTIFKRAFAYSGITKITFNTVAESGTGDLVCDSCYDLKQVYLLGDLYGVGSRAFIGCSSLKEVYIGKNVQHISEYAFAECTSLTDVYYEGSEEDWNNMYYKSQTGNNLLYNATFHFNYAMR